MINKVEKKVEPRVRQFSSEQDFLQDDTSLFIKGWAFKNLEGRMLTLVESMGLGEKQEEAQKQYVRREVWATINEAYVCSPETVEFIEVAFQGSQEAK